MAKEKYIRGKRDDANHAGLYHNRKQELAAQEHLEAYYRGDFKEWTANPKPPTIQTVSKNK